MDNDCSNTLSSWTKWRICIIIIGSFNRFLPLVEMTETFWPARLFTHCMKYSLRLCVFARIFSECAPLQNVRSNTLSSRTQWRICINTIVSFNRFLTLVGMTETILHARLFTHYLKYSLRFCVFARRFSQSASLLGVRWEHLKYYFDCIFDSI